LNDAGREERVPCVIVVEGGDGGWGIPIPKASTKNCRPPRDPGNLALGCGIDLLAATVFVHDAFAQRRRIVCLA
jgi:hypothetical protein